MKRICRLVKRTEGIKESLALMRLESDVCLSAKQLKSLWEICLQSPVRRT